MEPVGDQFPIGSSDETQGLTPAVQSDARDAILRVGKTAWVRWAAAVEE